MKITKERFEQIIHEEIEKVLEQGENNPWAICAANVGRDDKEKYESCVKQVKASSGEETP